MKWKTASPDSVRAAMKLPRAVWKTVWLCSAAKSTKARDVGRPTRRRKIKARRDVAPRKIALPRGDVVNKIRPTRIESA